MMKWFNRLLIVLLSIFAVAGILVRQDLDRKEQAFRKLTERVEVLEKIIYDEKIAKTEYARY